MSKRIRELEVEAGMQYRLNPKSAKIEGNTASFEELRVYDKFDLDKFTQSLLKEVINEIEFQYGGGSDSPEGDWDTAIKCVSSMIKHRFEI